MKDYKMSILEKQEKVLVTGGTGMAGRALQKLMPNAIYIGSEYDLTKYAATQAAFTEHEPEYVIHLAAKVSGMKGNEDAVADHYIENAMMNCNVLDVAKEFKVKKLLSVLSTCIYPDPAIYPLVEEDIHKGEPHSTNLGYGFSKRMLDVQARAYRKQYGCNFINIVPNNLFGEHDNFHLIKSHVIPSVIRKVYEAKRTNSPITLWGDGTPKREFTHSGDLAKIIIFSFDNYNGDRPINVGNTGEVSIKQLAELVCEILEYKNTIIWDDSVGNGQPRKPSDNSKFLELGWRKENYTNFRESLSKTCDWFLQNYPKVRGVE
tara:strand:+ start:3451 stop:4407 length:957 start_codon:yes stop_codon:yes gene_type:complete